VTTPLAADTSIAALSTWGIPGKLGGDIAP